MTAATDTAEKIVTAAAQLIAERGYAATSTRAIAERAGVNEVTLFRHFGNKLGVLRALGERYAATSATRALRKLPDPADARATLRAIAQGEIADSVENGGVALRLAFDAPSVPELRELMGEGPGETFKQLSGYMAEQQAAGRIRRDIPPMVLAEAFSALTSSYVMYRMVMGVIDGPAGSVDDETVDQLFDVFWSGARGREETCDD